MTIKIKLDARTKTKIATGIRALSNNEKALGLLRAEVGNIRYAEREGE